MSNCIKEENFMGSGYNRMQWVASYKNIHRIKLIVFNTPIWFQLYLFDPQFLIRLDELGVVGASTIFFNKDIVIYKGKEQAELSWLGHTVVKTITVSPKKRNSLVREKSKLLWHMCKKRYISFVIWACMQTFGQRVHKPCIKTKQCGNLCHVFLHFGQKFIWVPFTHAMPTPLCLFLAHIKGLGSVGFVVFWWTVNTTKKKTKWSNNERKKLLKTLKDT